MPATTVTLELVTLDDLIGCTICGAEVTIGQSKCIEGHRVCADCFGPDEAGELEPPF
jgi:hypothetical protein